MQCHHMDPVPIRWQIEMGKSISKRNIIAIVVILTVDNGVLNTELVCIE